VIKSAENFKLVTITKSHQQNFLSKLFELGILCNFDDIKAKSRYQIFFACSLLQQILIFSQEGIQLWIGFFIAS